MSHEADTREIAQGQATLELRRSIVRAMDVGMTQAEIIEILKSAIEILMALPEDGVFITLEIKSDFVDLRVGGRDMRWSRKTGRITDTGFFVNPEDAEKVHHKWPGLDEEESEALDKGLADYAAGRVRPLDEIEAEMMASGSGTATNQDDRWEGSEKKIQAHADVLNFPIAKRLMVEMRAALKEGDLQRVCELNSQMFPESGSGTATQAYDMSRIAPQYCDTHKVVHKCGLMLGAANAPDADTRFDRALLNMALAIQGGGHDGESLLEECRRIEAELRRRLLPTLQELWDLSECPSQCGESICKFESARKLMEETWLK